MHLKILHRNEKVQCSFSMSRTSELCCPSVGGADLGSFLIEENLTAGPTWLIGPRESWIRSCLSIPLCRTCGSEKTSANLLTGPYGNLTPASRNTLSQSEFVLSWRREFRISMSSWRFLTRSGFVEYFSDLARSPSPIAEQNSTNCTSFPAAERSKTQVVTGFFYQPRSG